jgi:alcohol dehydrogenase, propanol-preferring
MRAVRYIGEARPQVMDVPTPAPGPGEVLVRIGGAGVCHSDLHVLDHSIG